MIRLGNILHPADFSDASLPATEYATELARRFDAALHMLYVIDEPLIHAPVIAGYVPCRDEFEAYADAGLRNWLQDDVSAGLEIHLRKAFGKPFVKIIEDAKATSLYRDSVVWAMESFTGAP